MQKINKLIILLVFILCTNIAAQASPNTMYFMNYLPYRSYMNPALQPYSKVYVELPGISTVYAGAYGGGLSMNDLFYVKEGKLVSVLHPEYGNKDALYNKLKESTNVWGESSVSLLGFGFKVKENGYFTFNTSIKGNYAAVMPKDVAKLGFYGTPDTINSNKYNFDKLAVYSNTYLDINGGYSHRINDQWTVGGRLHILVGAANTHINQNELDLTTTIENWNLKGDAQAKISMPGLEVVYDENGKPTGLKMPDNINDILGAYKASMGASIDLGMEYKPIKDLSITFALNDLGFMYWNNAINAKGKIDYNFKGIHYVPGQENINYGDSIVQAILQAYEHNTTNDGYATAMKAKMFVGLEYSFLKDMMSASLLSRTEYMNNLWHQEVTLGYNLRPCHWFSLSASYSLVSSGYNTFGLGLNLRLPPFNFYVVSDYTPVFYSNEGIPYRSQIINIQAGIVLTFKAKKDNTDKQFYEQSYF